MVSTLVGIGIKLQVIMRTSLMQVIHGPIVVETIVILLMLVFSTSTETMEMRTRITGLGLLLVLNKFVIQD